MNQGIRNTGSRASASGSRSRRPFDPLIFSRSGPACFSPSEPGSAVSCVSGIYTDMNNDYHTTMHPLTIDPRRPVIAEPQSRSPLYSLFTDFAPDTPTSASSGSSCQPLTPTSPFDKDTVMVMDEEMDVDVDRIAGYRTWGDKCLYSEPSGKLPQRSESWLNYHATAANSQSTEMTTISEANGHLPDFDDFWDSLVQPTPQQMDPVGAIHNVRYSYAPQSANTFHDSSPNATFSSLSDVTSIPQTDTFVSPQYVSPPSLVSPSQYAPAPARRQVSRHSIPLHQPQPIRPIPPIPIVDLSDISNSSFSDGSTPRSSRSYRGRSKPLTHVAYQMVHQGDSGLSENSLLCQPVSDTVRFQSQPR